MEETVAQLADLINLRFPTSARFLPKNLNHESRVKKVEFIDLALNNWVIQMFSVSEYSIEVNLFKLQSYDDANDVAKARSIGDIDFFPNHSALIKTFNIHHQYGSVTKYQIPLLVREGEPEPKNLDLDGVVDFIESEFKSFDARSTPPATPA